MPIKISSTKAGGGAGGAGFSRKGVSTKRAPRRKLGVGIPAASVARRSSGKTYGTSLQTNAPATKGFRDLLGRKGAKR